MALTERKRRSAFRRQLDRRDGASAPSAVDSERIRRVFIVGCGHSGTSLLLRTIVNMRGIYCIPKETYIFEKERSYIENAIQSWDRKAKEGNFTHWAEKTPKVG